MSPGQSKNLENFSQVLVHCQASMSLWWVAALASMGLLSLYSRRNTRVAAGSEPIGYLGVASRNEDEVNERRRKNLPLTG